MELKNSLSICIGMLSLFSGCVTDSKTAGLPEGTASLRTRMPEQIHWKNGTKEDEAVDAWVDQVLKHDLTLASATQIGLFNNRGLQATYERLGVTQAKVVQAILRKNPSLTLGLGIPLFGKAGLSNDVSLIQEFLDRFTLPLRKRFAEAEFAKIKFEVTDAIFAFRTELRSAFLHVQTLQQLVEMRRGVTELAQSAAELAQKQQEVGNINELDSAHQQAHYAQAKLDLLQNEARLSQAREHLNQLLGLFGKQTQWTLKEPLPDLPKEEDLATRIHAEARAARMQLLTKRASVEYYQTTLLPLQERMVALSQQQYNAMLLGVYQLLTAKQNEITTYQAYLEALRDYFMARLELERVLGSVLPEASSTLVNDPSSGGTS